LAILPILEPRESRINARIFSLLRSIDAAMLGLFELTFQPVNWKMFSCSFHFENRESEDNRPSSRTVSAATKM
jgi:hypothetical protein